MIMTCIYWMVHSIETTDLTILTQTSMAMGYRMMRIGMTIMMEFLIITTQMMEIVEFKTSTLLIFLIRLIQLTMAICSMVRMMARYMHTISLITFIGINHGCLIHSLLKMDLFWITMDMIRLSHLMIAERSQNFIGMLFNVGVLTMAAISLI